MSKTYLLIDDEQQGPYSVEEIRKMLSTGKISAETPCWEEGLPEWQPLGSLQKDLEHRTAPATIAPPRRSQDSGRSQVTVNFKKELHKEYDLSVRAKPVTVGKAIALFLIFILFLTATIVIFGRSMPDIAKKFAAAADDSAKHQ